MTMKKTINFFYSVRIFPDGLDGEPTIISFDSYEEKESYIKKERQFCLKKENEYHGETISKEREKKKNDFYMCRVRFAEKEGKWKNPQIPTRPNQPPKRRA